jgi:hypothetical protein
MTAPSPLPATDQPALAKAGVTAADVFDDQQWFADHPERRYRRRPGPDGAVWVIRRRGRAVYLRALVTTGIRYPDNDEALRQLWFLAAWPDLTPLERDELIKAARQAEHATHATGRAKAARQGRRRAAAKQTPSPLTDIQNRGKE